jgi:hypothetical protein
MTGGAGLHPPSTGPLCPEVVEQLVEDLLELPESGGDIDEAAAVLLPAAAQDSCSRLEDVQEDLFEAQPLVPQAL